MYINNIYKVVIYFRAVKLLKTRNLENSYELLKDS